MATKVDQWLTPEGLLQITGWARDGLIQKDIAHNMRCSLKTLQNWRDKYPEIKAALLAGKEVADRIVENALYRSATGYTATVKEPVKVRDIEYDPVTGKKLSERERYITVEKEIHIPAQVTAQIFWLKNRKPQEWREKHDVVMESNGVLESLLEMEQKA